jgi:hypothetical protein
MERCSRTARVGAVVIAVTVGAVLVGCTSDDTEPEDDQPLRIDGPAQVDESLLDGPGADLDPGGGG